MTAATACRACGTEPLGNARFCHGCGAPVQNGDTRAEYKQVTVLFADVVHSMDIAATVGPERLREVMAELADQCAAVVQRYGGTVDKFTGDGIMAVFGAPVALEDHAVRACLAALGIQEETTQLANAVRDCDGVELQLRVGLNSGQVIAGEIGSGPFGYTAVGEQVGMAQRMESVAPPGGVVLSGSTARLVEGTVTLGESELVQIKGADAAVPVRRLLGMGDGHRAARRAESNLVGRQWEMSIVEGLLDRAVDGPGGVVGVVGPPGIGKSRLVREVAAMARRRNVEVFSTFCESHATDVPFRVVARLLRTAFGVEGLAGQEARNRVRDAVPDADSEDLLLFDDLLGIADSEAQLPKIDPDARRRRLTALVSAAALARHASTVYVIEDAHWIDEVSESMLAEFLTVIPQTHSLVLVTCRPEYRGALMHVAAQTIALAPLSDPETATLASELLGTDPSVDALGQRIAERVAGNPFFAEEIVRELAERGVLQGQNGAYLSTAEIAEVTVPATLQVTIAARIDRLDPKAKRTLNAAAVLGARFGVDLLTALGMEPAVDGLVAAQLIDQVGLTRQPEYAFHHPLIRTVAYESQLKSDRAELHRRVAAAINAVGSADENAALIAGHLEAAGDLKDAYAWHMRAGTWSAIRDIAAARLSWARARRVADTLPGDHPDRASMRITPRTLLCGSAWRVGANDADLFKELQDLCAAAGDKASLAIAMTGPLGEHMLAGRVNEASRVATEQMALIESIADPTLTIGLSVLAMAVQHEAAQMTDVLRWSQTVIDLSGGDPTKGNMFMGSPLAWALTQRGFARWALGQRGWRNDFADAISTASTTDPITHAYVVNIKYTPGITCGVVLPDDDVLEEIEAALRVTERTADDLAMGMARLAFGVALVHRKSLGDRERGVAVLRQTREMCEQGRLFRSNSRFADIYLAREHARQGDRDNALAVMRAATSGMFDNGQWGAFIPATAVFVETLLDSGSIGIWEAETAIKRLADLSFEDGFVMRDIWLLRLRALLARARGNEPAYRDYRDRYRDLARTLGYEGHIAWAETMP